jgi:three-Cys-motif partner protein
VSDEHHAWVVGGPLPLIRPHSVAKHRVIAKYLSRYIDTLTSNPRMPAFKLTLIDGFAGGGLYLNEQTKQEHFGSPLLMLKTMQKSAALLQERRSKAFNLDVDYLFVESSPDHFPFLKQYLEKSDFKDLLGAGKINLFNDFFVNQIEPIIEHLQNRRRGNRAIFVLDQFGYTDVPFPRFRELCRV